MSRRSRKRRPLRKMRHPTKRFEIVDLTNAGVSIDGVTHAGFFIVADLPVKVALVGLEKIDGSDAIIDKMIVAGPFTTEAEARNRLLTGIGDDDMRVATEHALSVVGFMADPVASTNTRHPGYELAKGVFILMLRATVICSGPHLCDDCAARHRGDKH